MKLILTVYNHFMLGVSCIQPSISLIHLEKVFFFNTRPRSNVNSNLIQRKKAVNYLN